VAVGNHEGAPLAALGIVALAGGAWHSVRGGTIDPRSPAQSGLFSVAASSKRPDPPV
jgi:hypothetical protein